MNEPDDLALLRDYAGTGSEAAFGELVARRVDFVYSAALRQTRDPHRAEEITQAVFVLLARKAGKIFGKTILAGWLFQATRYTALAQSRAEMKRSLRTATIEKELQMRAEIQPAGTDDLWPQMSPLLDEALAALGETDRQAVLLRFFENRSLAEVGQRLGLGEDAARKRIGRALEKLHRHFSRRGVHSTTAMLAGAIPAHAVHAAPPGLAPAVSALAAAQGAAATASTLTLIKGSLKIMAWTKMKTVIVASAVAMFAAGMATMAVHRMLSAKDNYPWQTLPVSSELLEKAPPMVKIVPTKFLNKGTWVRMSDGRILCIGQNLKAMIGTVTKMQPTRIVTLVTLPDGQFDYIASLPFGSEQALQAEIKKKFHVMWNLETLKTNVLILLLKNSKADGLKISTGAEGFTGGSPGHLSLTNWPISMLADMLEARFRIPVVDQTALAGRYDLNLTWNEHGQKVGDSFPDYPNLNGLEQALQNQLGLELVPTNMPIQMLVVEKAK